MKAPREPIPLSIYGLKEMVSKSNSQFKFYSMPKEVVTAYIGVELEFAYSPGGKLQRRIKDFLIKKKYLTSVTSDNSIVTAIEDNYFRKGSALLQGGPVRDGGGVEVITQVCSLAAHQAVLKEYEYILNVFNSCRDVLCSTEYIYMFNTPF